jgi:Na+/H+ antiporter NhaC
MTRFSRATRWASVLLLGGCLAPSAARGADAAAAAPADYGAWSLLPPLVAIGLAIATRHVVLSLMLGVATSALLLAGGHPLSGTSRLASFLWDSLKDFDHLHVYAFTLMMGAMVGVLNRAGGMHGLVEVIAPLAANRRRGQLAGWILGLLIFFDDYANTLLLGSTLRPLFDRLKLSR